MPVVTVVKRNPHLCIGGGVEQALLARIFADGVGDGAGRDAVIDLRPRLLVTRSAAECERCAPAVRTPAPPRGRGLPGRPFLHRVRRWPFARSGGYRRSPFRRRRGRDPSGPAPPRHTPRCPLGASRGT